MADPIRSPWDLDPEFEGPALELFGTLFELSDSERTARLDEACADNPALRAAVLGLLRDHANPPPILSRMMDRVAREPALAVGLGATVGPYRIESVIGRGGMGIVYRARQDRPHRTVALKVMSSSAGDEDAARRFEREVEVLGLLEHPGICRIYGAGAVDLGLGFGETPYFAMEFVDGKPLTEFARERALAAEARCRLIAAVAEAVQHAHDHGIVHRDLKPGNILVTEDTDGSPEPCVLDFGIARAIQREVGAPVLDTRTGMLLGTLQYMSPEQLNGSARNIDARSDVYALGVLLYELLAGRPPLQLDDLPLATVCRLVARREPPRLGSVDRRLRGDLETIVHKALQKDREDRYQSAAEFGADLGRFLRREPIMARPHTATYQLRKFAQRNRGLVASVAVLMAVMITGLVALAVLASHNDALARSEHRIGEQLRASLYRSQMRLGVDAMASPGGVGRLRQIVADWVPAPGAVDLRGFEWYLLRANAHRELAVFASERAPQGLQWLGDGTRLAAIYLHHVALLDAATGTELERFAVDDTIIAPACVSADGSVLAQGVNRTSMRTLSTRTGATIATFDYPGPVFACVLSADGAWLATHQVNYGIVIWNARTGARMAELPEATKVDTTGAMAFSPDGRWFTAGQRSSCHVRVWRTDDWSKSRAVGGQGPDYPIHLAFDATGTRLGTAGYDGRLQIWNVESGVLEHVFEHIDTIRGLAFDPAGHRVAVGCRDSAVYVYDLTSGQRQTLTGHTGIAARVAWSPDGDRLASIGDDRSIRIWNPAMPAAHRSIGLPLTNAAEYGQLQWSADGRRLAIHVSHGRVATWRVESGAVEDAFAIECGDRRFIYDFATRRIECADARREPSTMLAAAEPVRFVCPNPAGDRLVVVDGRSRQLFWSAGAESAVEHVDPADVRGVAWLADGNVAMIDSYDRVRILAGATGEELAVRPIPECTLALAAAPVGDGLAIGCVDHAVRLLSTSDPSAVSVLRGHAGAVQAVAFSADGRRLASGGRDRTVRIWDVAGRAELAVLSCADHVIAVAWSPDGLRLAALDVQGKVDLWDARAATDR